MPLERVHDGAVGGGFRSQPCLRDGHLERQSEVAGQSGAQGVEQLFVRGRESAADHDHGGVDRHDQGRDPMGEFIDEAVELLLGGLLSGARQGEHLGGRRGGAPRDLPGLGVQATERQATDVSRRVVDAASGTAPEDEAHGDAVADGQVDDVVDELRDAEVVLRDGRESHAVVDGHGAAERLTQLRADVDAGPLRDDDRGGDPSVVVDDAGQGDADRPQTGPRQRERGESAADVVDHRGELGRAVRLLRDAGNARWAMTTPARSATTTRTLATPMSTPTTTPAAAWKE